MSSFAGGVNVCFRDRFSRSLLFLSLLLVQSIFCFYSDSLPDLIDFNDNDESQLPLSIDSGVMNVKDDDVLSQSVPDNEQPIIMTKVGLIRGTLVKRKDDGSSLISRQQDVDVFLGIPFALPPVGEYRFMPPRPWDQPLLSDDQVYDATKEASICIQAVKEIVIFPFL
jgi:hypothetical protein